eukprot:11433791-Prorocentrum_lima.AAC.1
MLYGKKALVDLWHKPPLQEISIPAPTAIASGRNLQAKAKLPFRTPRHDSPSDIDEEESELLLLLP